MACLGFVFVIKCSYQPIAQVYQLFLNISLSVRVYLMVKDHKVSRKDLLKTPDQFLSMSEKAMLYFMDNRAGVLGGFVAILIVISSFFGFKYYQVTKTLHNEALYFEMEKIVSNAKGNDPAPEARLVWEKIGAGFQKDRAALLLADIHFKNQELDKAEVLYTLVMSNSSQGQINYQMAQLGLAYNYESNKDFKKAIEILKSIIDANTGYPLFEIYWSLSRCYELNNDAPNALLILREMQIKFPNNQQSDKIDQRIKQLSA
jgi:tetratricopeptide (TPR) repeat protein